MIGCTFQMEKISINQLFADIEQATESIHLLYFIVREDEVGEKLIDLLTQKASQGVEVRLVYDSAGCFGTRLNYFKTNHRSRWTCLSLSSPQLFA